VDAVVADAPEVELELRAEPHAATITARPSGSRK